MINKEKYGINKTIALLFFVLTLIACSGGGGDEYAGNNNDGGIDGTGITGGVGAGEITGFGSVIFGDSIFATNSATQFFIDDNLVAESDLKIGMTAQFEIGNDATPTLNSGTAIRVAAQSSLKGVVTSINPLAVLGQTIVADSHTLFANIAGNNLASVSVDDVLSIYGFLGADGILRATRIERHDGMGGNTLTEWKLKGKVTAVSTLNLEIGSQVVSTNSVIAEGCGAGVSVGDFLTIEADPNPVTGFSVLNLVTRITCGDSGIPIPNNPQSSLIPGEFEGIVSDYIPDTNDELFFVGGQQVSIMLSGSNITEFEGGTIADLINGVQVEAEGIFDTVSGVLIAEKVEFKRLRTEIVAPVDPATVNVANDSFEVMGITVLLTPATDDETHILSGGVVSVRQLAIKGSIESGVIMAEEIRDEGTPKFDEVKLQGPLANQNPNTFFDILGVQINLNGLVQFVDDTDQIIVGGAASFFSLVADGDFIEVKGELLTVGAPTIIAAEVKIDH